MANKNNQLFAFQTLWLRFGYAFSSPQGLEYDINNVVKLNSLYNNIENKLDSNLYIYFSVNRCFKWNKGDISPAYKTEAPLLTEDVVRPGTHQFDLGAFKGSADSISIELALPKKYVGGGISSFKFAGNYSFNYYANGYCPFSPPCSPIPTAKPPIGFYLNPATGVILYHLYAPGSDFTIVTDCKAFKKDKSGKMQHVSTQSKFQGSAYNYYHSDTLNNYAAEVKNLKYYYNVCENITDSFTFFVTDIKASKQIIPDTAEFKWISDLPGATVKITNPGQAQPEVRIIWKPPVNSYLHNPYPFNFYTHEKLCSPDRRYVFRSAEFNAVPKPSVTVKLDSTPCGFIKFSALNPKDDYKYKWSVFNGQDTISRSQGDADSAPLTKPGKWYVKLSLKNAFYGCGNTYFDSITIINAKTQVAITPKTAIVCKNAQVNFTSLVTNAKAGMQYQWFNNDNPVSNVSSYSFNAADSTRIKLTISLQNGCKATDSALVSVRSAPAFNRVADTALCENETIVLKALPVASKETITWLFNQSHAVTQPISKSGSYSIRYTNAYGCSATDTFTVFQNQSLIPNKYNDIKVCLHDSADLFFSINLNIKYDTISWYGNAGIKILYPFKVRIDNPQSIKLKVYGMQNNKQCMASDTFTIGVHPKTDSAIVVSSPSECLKQNLFAVRSTNNISSISKTIDWGDGQQSLFTTNTSHHYIDTGAYLLKVTFANSKGCKDTFTGKAKVIPSPVAAFSISDTAGCVNNNLFTLTTTSKTGSSSPSSSISHALYWGDNTIKTFAGNASRTHSYSTSNNFKISLTATSGNGCSDTASENIHIKPASTATIKVKGFCLGDSTYFEAVSSSNIKSYLWFLNGSSNAVSQSKFFVLLLSSLGSNTITLKTFSTQGCSAMDSVTFNIIEKPKADFDFYSYGQSGSGIRYYFKNTSKGGDSWLWDFNSKGSSILENSEFTFTDTGRAKIRLRVGSFNICYDSTEKNIPVLDKVTFYFPNIFSPNSNGTNDGFGLNANQFELVSTYKISIYNRWGEKLFESDQVQQHWNPTKPLTGIYIYKAEVRDVFGVLHEYKGVVEILE